MPAKPPQPQSPRTQGGNTSPQVNAHPVQPGRDIPFFPSKHRPSQSILSSTEMTTSILPSSLSHAVENKTVSSLLGHVSVSGPVSPTFLPGQMSEGHFQGLSLQPAGQFKLKRSRHPHPGFWESGLLSPVALSLHTVSHACTWEHPCANMFLVH